MIIAVDLGHKATKQTKKLLNVVCCIVCSSIKDFCVASSVDPDQTAPLKLFAYWVILHAFLSSALFHKSCFFQRILSGVPSQCWNSLNPDQAQQVGLALSQNCL